MLRLDPTSIQTTPRHLRISCGQRDGECTWRCDGTHRARRSGLRVGTSPYRRVRRRIRRERIYPPTRPPRCGRERVPHRAAVPLTLNPLPQGARRLRGNGKGDRCARGYAIAQKGYFLRKEPNEVRSKMRVDMIGTKRLIDLARANFRWVRPPLYWVWLGHQRMIGEPAGLGWLRNEADAQVGTSILC